MSRKSISSTVSRKVSNQNGWELPYVGFPLSLHPSCDFAGRTSSRPRFRITEPDSATTPRGKRRHGVLLEADMFSHRIEDECHWPDEVTAEPLDSGWRRAGETDGTINEFGMVAPLQQCASALNVAANGDMPAGLR